MIMDTPDARNIDYEYAGAGRTKPTFGAVRVTDLLRSVTNQYDRLRKFSYKLRFLLDIQITILDEYHSRLRGSLESLPQYHLHGWADTARCHQGATGSSRRDWCFRRHCARSSEAQSMWLTPYGNRSNEEVRDPVFSRLRPKALIFAVLCHAVGTAPVQS